MKKRKIILIIFLFISAIYIVRNKKNVDLEEVRNLDNVDIEYAYLKNKKLYIKQKYKQKHILFSADLSEISDKLMSDNIVSNNIIKIKKEDIKIEDEFDLKTENYKKIPAVPRETWSNIVIRNALLELIKFVPKTKNKGLLVAINKYEFVLYRDDEDQIKFCYVYEKPINVVIKKNIK